MNANRFIGNKSCMNLDMNEIIVKIIVRFASVT